MKIGSDIVTFFVFYMDDDDTSVLNLSNYNKDGAPEAPHFAWVLLEAQIVTAPPPLPPLPPLKKLRVATHQLRN